MAWLSGWAHRYALTLDNTNSPNLASGFQSNLVLNAGNFDFTLALASGADLRVTDSDGTTLLPFYLASYDGTANGSLWLKKSLSATTATTVYLYCGNAGATSVSSYDSTFGKLAVDANTLCLMHLDDGSGSSAVDATGTYAPVFWFGPPTWASHDGGGWGSASNQFTSGSYVSFNGTNQLLAVPGLLDTWPAQGTIEGWWFSPPSNASSPRIFSKWNSTTAGVDVAWNGSGSFGAVGSIYLGVYNSGGFGFRNSNVIISAGTWHHIAVTWTGGLFSLYVDGAKQATYANGAYTPASGSANAFFLGAYQGGGSVSACSFDEWRISNVCRLPEEMHATYLRRVYMKGMEESGRWATSSISDAIVPTLGYEGNLVLEPCVIPDASVPGYRMSYTLNGASLGIATSTDGLTWTRYSGNPIFSSAILNGSWLLKVGSTYYIYCVNGYNNANMYYATSTDGVTFGSTTQIIANGAQAWLAGVSNMCVVPDATNSRYVMALSNFSLGGGTCRTGFATATAPAGPWTLWSGNPCTVMAYGAGTYTPRSLTNDGSGWWHLYSHCSYDNHLFPDELYHYKLSNADWAANNFNNWVKVTSDPVFPLLTESFSGGAADQRADPCLVNNGSSLTLYFDLDRNVSGVGQQAKIGQAVFSGTLANLLTDRPVVSLGSIQAPVTFLPAWAAYSNQFIGLGIF